jgi:hypothetical protein
MLNSKSLTQRRKGRKENKFSRLYASSSLVFKTLLTNTFLVRSI